MGGRIPSLLIALPYSQGLGFPYPCGGHRRHPTKLPGTPSREDYQATHVLQEFAGRERTALISGQTEPAWNVGKLASRLQGEEDSRTSLHGFNQNPPGEPRGEHALRVPLLNTG